MSAPADHPLAERGSSEPGTHGLFTLMGLFAWTGSLQRFGHSPARKVFVIGRTLALEAQHPVHALAEGAPPVSAAAAQLRIDAALERGIALFANQPLVPLAELRLPALPAWDPLDALAELMVADCGAQALRSVKRRLYGAGMGLGYGELHDVSTVYVNTHLRSAVASFDPRRGEGKEAAWLATVLYRFALQHALLSHRLAANFELAFEVADPAASPQEQLAAEQQDGALRSLPAALQRLPDHQRQALALYFGLAGPEHSIKQMAQALDTNPYFARLALTHGVIALAAGLDAQGLLSQDELQLAQGLFIEGQDPLAAARQRGTTASEIKSQISRVAERVRSLLRQRTVLPRLQSPTGDEHA